MLFLLIGAVSAAEVNNVSSTEDSNLISDNDDSLSVENKLGVSNENSISDTNIVNSHDDDLNNCLDNDVLKSTYEDNYGQVQTSNSDVAANETSNDDVLSVSSDDNLTAKSVSTTLEVSDTHYAKSATYFKVTLKGDGKGISGQKISLKVNGKTYSAVSDANGIASIKTAALAIGTYNVALTYAGNEEYASSSLSKKVKVLSSISGSDITVYYGPVSEFKVTFWKNYNALANTKVSFKVNGVTYTKTTDKNGVAIFPVNLAPGSYVITSINPYSQEQASNNYISKKDSTTLTHGSTSTNIAPNTKYSFTVTLKSKQGILIQGKTIVFKYNNKQVTAKTNENGKATITIPALSKGTYSISYSYSGDKYYSGSSESGKLYVKESSVKLTSSKLNSEYKDGSKFAVTLKDGNTPLSNKKVKIIINGVTYTRTTDSNGVAYQEIGLSPNTYTVTYEYLTPGEYDYCHGSNTIVVSKQTVSLTAGDLVMKYKDVTDYKVTVKDKSGKPLKGVNVAFTINGKTYTHATDANGVAKQAIGLNIGEYTIKTVVSSDNYKSSTVTKHVSVLEKIDSKVKLTSSKLNSVYKDGSKFAVTLKNDTTPMANEKVKITVNGVTYTKTTDAKGVAYLDINLIPNTYTVTYEYLTPGKYDYCHGSNTIVVSKQTASLTAGDLVMNYKNVTDYEVTVKDKSGKPLKGVNVAFTINGKTYTHATDANGVAKQAIGLNIGYYTIKTVVSNKYYQSSTITKHVSVLGTKLTGSNLDVSPNTKVTFSVKATDYKNNPVKGSKITFTMDGKTYNSTTDSTGVAKVSLGTLSLGTHTIKYSQGTFSGSSKIVVANKVTLSQIISASKTVKSYIEKNSKLPSNVTINGVSYSTAQYMYFASKAIVNLKSGSKADIVVKSVTNPSSPLSTYAAGNLYDYLSVAKNLVSTVDSNGKMPNSVDSDIGIIGYQPAVYAFARVVAFYDSNDVMPAYVTIKSLDSTATSGINPKNTISDLSAYLKASTNCQVNNSQIKKLVDSLTKGLKTDKEKATAIYNYVRDSISYSFYYNTRHGGVGTLNAKSGNCVDQSHLLVAMYRTAGLAARYAHGTCTFSSGTYGHVWTQVLIGDTWTVGDPTSNRNSLGKIANWNTNSYKLNGYYSSIGF